MTPSLGSGLSESGQAAFCGPMYQCGRMSRTYRCFPFWDERWIAESLAPPRWVSFIETLGACRSRSRTLAAVRATSKRGRAHLESYPFGVAPTYRTVTIDAVVDRHDA